MKKKTCKLFIIHKYNKKSYGMQGLDINKHKSFNKRKFCHENNIYFYSL